MIGIDLDHRNLSVAQREYRTDHVLLQQMSGQNLAFRAASFDVARYRTLYVEARKPL